MTSRPRHYSSLRSLSELGERAEMLLAVGAWHLAPSPEVLKPNGRQFDYKNERRVVICEVNGPNVLAYARTMSVSEGLEHPPHLHDDFICQINGHPAVVVTKFPVHVRLAVLSSTTYSCLEPEDSELAGLLANRRSG